MINLTDGAILGTIIANICLMWFRIGRLEGRLGRKIDNANNANNPKKKERK